jgi:serine phosphatase RsbU (regulator of sigma subunit)
LPRLTDYLNEADLRGLQDAFSTVAGMPISICDPDGTPLRLRPAEKDWTETFAPEGLEEAVQRQKRRRSPQAESAPADLSVQLDGETVGRVRLTEARPSAQRLGDPQAETRGQLLKLLSGLLVRLCEANRKLHHRVDDLVALYRVTAQFSERHDVQGILDEVTRVVVETFDAKASAIRLLSPSGKELLMQASWKFTPEYIEKGPLLVADSAVDRQVLETGQPVYVADMRSDPRVVYPDEARAEGYVSGLCVPLMYKNRPEGVLRVYMGEAFEFDWFDKQLLRTIASGAAAAIVNARLLDEAQEGWQVRRQLQIAATVQQRMIPTSSPAIPGMDIHAVYVPSQEVGGDFYDFIPLPQGNLGVAICDVCGKGVPASLLMASIRFSLRAHAAGVYDMSEVLSLVNRDLCAGTLSSDFATMFYGVLRHEDRMFTYACAGHMPPILVRGGEVCQLETGGGVLGVLPDMEFPQDYFHLEAGDTIFAYTDGLNEALNFQGQEYGRERIEQALLFAVEQGYSAHAAADYVVWDMRRFAGLHARPDDLTLVCIRVL